MVLKIAWGITGCGDLLEETYNIMVDLKRKYNLNVKVFTSKNGELVLKWYKLWKGLEENFPRPLVEKGPNSPFIAGDLQIGKYDLLLICPTTANSTAKIANGIADSLITNAVAQTTKGGTPVYIYPADQREGPLVTDLPNGSKLTLKMRNIDIENVEKLKKIEGITVLSHPSEIEDVILKFLKEKSRTSRTEEST